MAVDDSVDLNRVVSHMDAPDYMLWIVNGTSAQAGVRERVLATPEAKVLLAHCGESVPLIAQSLTTQGKIRQQYTPIAYFVILGACKDPSALPIIADYLETLSYTDDYEILSHVYSDSLKAQKAIPCGLLYTQVVLYALDALRTFDISNPGDDSCSLFLERHTIAQAARKEFARRTGLR